MGRIAPSVEIMRLPATLAYAAWPEVAPLIAPAVDMSEGRHTLATVLRDVQACEAQAFLALRNAKPIMACITRVALYPAQKWVQVPFCGGRDIAAWLEPMVDALDRLAWTERCAGIEIFGRPGWVRVLKPHGYRRSGSMPWLLAKRFGVIDDIERAA